MYPKVPARGVMVSAAAERALENMGGWLVVLVVLVVVVVVVVVSIGVPSVPLVLYIGTDQRR
jgi:hypothetical protein